MRGFNLFRAIFLVFLIFGRRRFGFEFRMLCPFFFLERLELFFQPHDLESAGVLMGALIIGSAGAFQIMRLKKELKTLKKEERAKHPELEAEPAAPENQKD